jgi:hypothetical protein
MAVYGKASEFAPRYSSAALAKNAERFLVTASILAMREESIEMVNFLVSCLGIRAMSAVVYSLFFQSSYIPSCALHNVKLYTRIYIRS